MLKQIQAYSNTLEEIKKNPINIHKNKAEVLKF